MVILSVRLSVTTQYRFKTRWDSNYRFLPYDSFVSLVFSAKISCCWVKGVPWMRGKRGAPPWKGVILPLLARLTWKWLQIGTDVLLIITSTGNGLLRNVDIDDIEWPWTSQIGAFIEFFCDFGLWHAFQEWIAPKWLEIDQDNLHIKFSR